MTFVIQPIVEGFGETHSIRTLICRIGMQYSSLDHVEVLTPMNAKGSENLKTKLENFVQFAEVKIRQSEKTGGVLILLDSDDNCPASLAPQLLERAKTVCGHLPISVVMAHREYESWFLASASSIPSLGTNTVHPEPETVRGAKEWLSQTMQSKYNPVDHQASFTTVFDLAMARAGAPSFDKLCRDLEQMFTVLRAE